MMKEQCAVRQRPCSNPNQEVGTLPFADWNVARSCLKFILEESAVAQDDNGPGIVPLSNVKRLFRSRFEVELSETKLGHSKLSELLQDACFGDLCYVQLEGHGYTVVQKEQ